MATVKDRRMNAIVSEELYAAVIAKSKATGIIYSAVIRRALENFVVTGVLPPPVPAAEPARRKSRNAPP